MKLCEAQDVDLMQGLTETIPDPTQLLEVVALLKKKSYLKAAVLILSASPIVTDKLGIEVMDVDESTDSWYHFTSDHITTISHFWPKIVDQLKFALPDELLNKLNLAVKRLVAWHIRARTYHRNVRVRTAQLNNVASRYGQTARYMDKLVKT